MAEKFVKSMLEENKVVIFSKSYCPFCHKVKQLFASIGVEPKVIEIEDRDDCAEIQAYLKQVTGASSVPRVFINGNVVGGCDDTFGAKDSGKLKTLLSEAGVESKL